MTWIDLGNPRPRTSPHRYEPVKWEMGETLPLPTVLGTLILPFNEALDGRLSQRQFGIVDDQQLAVFLWHACRTRGTMPSELGFDLEHRASPSAGAIHPIHVILKRPEDERWWLYHPQAHGLAELKNAGGKLAGLYEHSLEVLGGDNAVRILYLAEPGKTLGKYQEGNSLIWRDAGALLAVMALTASALGLNFCPLGITGEPWASNLSDEGKLAGVGLALLGSTAGA